MVRVLTKDNDTDKKQMFKTMCFNVLTHNRDDHTKNFSFFYTDMNGWRLAPAYDLTYSDTYWGEQTTSVGCKGKNITKKDLINLGVGAGLSPIYCEECYSDMVEKTAVLKSYLS